MPEHVPQLLYLGAQLPVRSETFVYREVLALRRRGCRVHVASVHPPERNLGSDQLEALADEAIPIYGPGGWRLVRDAACTWWRRPVRATRVVATAVRDSLWGAGVPPARRPKLLIQCLAALALDHRTSALTFDHVHAHMAHVPASIAMYLAMIRQVPFSFTGHAADLFRDYSLLPDKIRRAAFVACISHWHRDFYRQQVPGVAAQKLPIVRCGVEPAPAARRAPSPERPFQILAVGRLVEKKGFEVLIRALAGLGQRGPCLCRLVGDGPQRAELERLVREFELEQNFRFEGARSNGQVQEWLGEADLFVLPCRTARSGDRDGIPVVLMEAMAAGVPVISGDLPTIRELVQHRRTGWLVPPGDDARLREAILELMHDAPLRRQLAEAGREWVDVEFSQAINLERLARAFALEGPQGEPACREPQLC
jgi:colanic acid/amylovoran biosynthesis glycosyltransferase